jgi:hypothetical protein
MYVRDVLIHTFPSSEGCTAAFMAQYCAVAILQLYETPENLKADVIIPRAKVKV